MKKLLLYLVFAATYFSCVISVWAKETHGNSATAPMTTNISRYAAQQFEENKGQVTGEDAHRVNYFLKHGDLSLFLLDNGIAYQFKRVHYPEGYKHPDKFASREEREEMDALIKDIRVETYRMDVMLVGADPHSPISAEGKSTDYVQYYNHDALHVRSFSKIIYHNVYPNIDWVVYTKEGSVKYDFVVRPGGDPSQIKLQTRWAENLKLNADGSFTMANRMGAVTEQAPVSFQDGKQVVTEFLLHSGGLLSFHVPSYNPSETLIIDPSLVWSTYYGGEDEDHGYSCVTDGAANVYMAGWTYSGTNIASGGHQNTNGGVIDAFLSKFTSSGVRVWATYYGGGSQDFGTSCTLDSSGNVYLAGRARSSNKIASGGHQNTNGGGQIYDAFLAKFNSDGVRQWATYYGGSGWDEGWSCVVDSSGNVYLAGVAESASNIAFNGHQNTNSGGPYDAFLVKFNSGGVRQWATYYGGNLPDYGYSCVLDGGGNIYLAGVTQSTNKIAANGHQNSYGGGYHDAFLVKFSSDGVRQWGTYYGGSFHDEGFSCATDNDENVYLAGFAQSTSGIASLGHQTVQGGSWDAFLAKFNAAGVRQWATYYGGPMSDEGHSCVTDRWGNVYLAGFTQSGIGISFGDSQSYHGGSSDAFLAKFNSTGVRQWGLYYGGNAADEAYSCMPDNFGNVYVSGRTVSDSNIAVNGHQGGFGGGDWDGFLVKFLDSAIASPVEPLELPTGSDLSLISIYPNPAGSSLYIRMSEKAEIGIYSIAGQLMNRFTAEEYHIVDVSGYAPGLYFIKANNRVVKFLKR